MDNKGRVTVVLHWDQRHQDKQPAKGNEARSPNKRVGGERPSLVIQTSLDKLGTFAQKKPPCSRCATFFLRVSRQRISRDTFRPFLWAVVLSVSEDRVFFQQFFFNMKSSNFF